jgi:HAD superfamily hydrolase (TIGR01509 family)
VKYVIFDLDGVLVNTKYFHYQALNDALRLISDEYVISESEHLSIYDGLSTNKKLELLTKRNYFPRKHHEFVWKKKQEIVGNKLKNIQVNVKIIDAIKFLKKNGIKVFCCSNSIRSSIEVCLSRLGVLELFDGIYSNEDVNSPKPHPEIYWKCMIDFEMFPEETLIIEDSPSGILAAMRSGASVYRVDSPKDISKELLERLISNTPRNKLNMKWKNDKMNVLIPMAGAGSRFEKAGYLLPKPLIDVNGNPMIRTAVENLNIDANFIFVVQKEHRKKYNLDTVLSSISPDCKIVEVDGVTEGAACTTLLAEKFIDNDNPLVIANSDQFIEWNSSDFFYKFQEQEVDASMLTFEATGSKWSFVEVGESGFAKRVAEKDPISNKATAGVYVYKKGSDYVKYAKRMIEKNDRYKNEFYVCPVFNHFIEDGKKVTVFDIERMWGLGTPEDLEYFLENKKI